MKALVLLSGGIDSTTCLAQAVHEYKSENVVCLSIGYGQKHSKEVECARKVAEYYSCELIELDLSAMFDFSDCALLSHSDKEIPHESYAEQINVSGGKPVSTYVPFRNGLFISSAAAIAISKGCSAIYYGAHSDDAAGNAYPDCSEAFNKAMNDAVFVGSGEQVEIKAPFIGLSKKDVVALGLKLNAPYHLTWSCYEGKEKQCGVCGTCKDRRKAFELNNAQDPVEYYN